MPPFEHQHGDLGGGAVHERVAPQTQHVPQSPEMQASAEKLELYELIGGIRRGQLPTNGQLIDILNRLLDIPAIEQNKRMMSPDGQRLLDDLRKLIITLQKAIRVKNKDQLFQSLVYHLHNLELGLSKEQLSNVDVTGGVSREQVRKEAREGANALLKIGQLIVFNSQFRQQIQELVSIAQEVFGDVASKVGETLQSTGQELGEQTQRLGEEAQSMADRKRQEEMVDSLQRKLRAPPTTTEAQQQATGEEVENAQESVHQTSQKIKEQMEQQQEQTSSTMQQRTEQVKQGVQRQMQEARRYAREKLPPEKVDEIVERLKAALAQVQGHPEYQQAIDTIIILLTKWSSRLADVSKTATGVAAETTEQARSETTWAQAELEAKTIMEDWAQGRSMDPLIDYAKKIMLDVKNDSELREYYNQVAEYLRRLVKEPGYVNDAASTEDGKALVNRGRDLTQGKYGEDVGKLSNEIMSYMRAIEQDPIAQELETHFKDIHRDLWFDRAGNPAFKPNLLGDMRLTLLPAILEFIKVLPIPRIEYTDAEFDIVLENLVLAGDTLIPGLFEMKTDNHYRVNPRSTAPGINRQTIYVKMDYIQTSVKDVVFYYKRKMGFPKMSDRGVATLAIGGRGITVEIQLVSDSTDKRHTFRVTHCKCHVDRLKLNVRGSHHDVLYRVVQPLVLPIVRRQIAKAVEQKIVEALGDADQRLTRRITAMYQDALAKDAAASAVYQQQLESPAGFGGAAVQPQAPLQQQAAQPPAVAPQGPPTYKRPGLITAFFTIVNRNIKMNMVTSAQARQQKRAKQRAEKEAKAEAATTTEQQQQQEEQQAPATTENVPSDQPTTSAPEHKVAAEGYVIQKDDGDEHAAAEPAQETLKPTTTTTAAPSQTIYQAGPKQEQQQTSVVDTGNQPADWENMPSVQSANGPRAAP